MKDLIKTMQNETQTRRKNLKPTDIFDKEFITKYSRNS